MFTHRVLWYLEIILAMVFLAPRLSFGESLREMCNPDLREVARELVRHEFPNERATFHIVTYNELRCEEPEDMANVVITVTTERRGTMYGVFHIHFVHVTGELTSAAAFDNQKFLPMLSDFDWKVPWCRIVRLIYEDELKEQGCEVTVGLTSTTVDNRVTIDGNRNR